MVKYEQDSKIAFITLNNSDNGNRLNLSSLKLMNESIDKAVSDKENRAIVIRSNGENFCLGMDFSFLLGSHENHEQINEAVDLYRQLLLKIFEAPLPVIGVIQGQVKAGGMGIIAACDILLGTHDSSYELSEVIFGLIPANVLPFLLSVRLSLQKVRYLVITAKKLDAVEAKNIGLIDEIHDQNIIEKKLKFLLKNILRASPYALAQTKSFTKDLAYEDVLNSSNLAKDKLVELLKNQDIINGIKSFQEGDIPSWFDRFKPQNPLLIYKKEEI